MSFESCPICMDNIGEKNNCNTIKQFFVSTKDFYCED